MWVDCSDFIYASDPKWGAECVREFLNKNNCIVEFKKANGDLRKMKCTTNPVLVQPVHELNGKGDLVFEADTTRKPKPEGLITVYDVGIADWRSFRYERMVSFSADIIDN